MVSWATPWILPPTDCMILAKSLKLKNKQTNKKKQLPHLWSLQHRRPCFDSWVRKIHWRSDRLLTPVFLGFPGGSDGKWSTCNAWDLGSIPGLGRSPGKGKGYPVENSMDRGAGRLYSPWGRKESDMTEQLSLFFSLREKLISKIPSTPNILESLAIIGYRLTLYLS